MNKFSFWLKNFFACKLCWQLTIFLFLIILIAEIVLVFPFYFSFKKDHLNLFEKNTLQIAKVLTIDYKAKNFEAIEKDLMKYSAIRGGTIYDTEGNIVKKFGIVPNVSPADFENIPSINGHFYLKDKSHIYTLWNQQDLQLPFEMVAVLDSTELKLILSQFIKAYWDEAIILLLLLTFATLTISYLLLIRPIRKAYQFLQEAAQDVTHKMPHLEIKPNNELGYIFTVMNTTFYKLHLTLKSLQHKTIRLNLLNNTLEQQVERRTQQLRESNKELAEMALFPEQHSSPIFRTDLDGNILYANDASGFLFQFWSCEHTHKLPVHWIEMLRSILQTNTIKQIEVIADEKVFLLDLVPIAAENYVNIYGADISERKRVEQENQFLQSHDAVTKLYNKYFFELLLAERMHHVSLFGLFFLQINDYMTINQNLGHAIGDEFLAHIGQTLRHKISKEDLLGHFSQNIFVIALCSCHNIDDIDTFAFKLINAFTEPFVIETYTLHTSVNIGIALYPLDHTDIENLFQYADMALLQARDAGVNTYEFYTHEINNRVSKNHELYQDLHRAVLEKELSLVYQPQLSLHTNKIVGAETLIRWHHPKKGLIEPNEFIAILENSSLIFSITAWLFETAAALHQKLKQQRIGEFCFAINLTAKQLNQENLLDILKETLSHYSIDAKYIEIEITERVSLTDPEKCIEILNAIRALGFRIAIDDFGSDYSSLKYLQRLPIDKIKIDKSFVDGLDKNNENQKIIKAIIHLAKELNLQTLVEGVETTEQSDLLKNLGCDEIQGYLVSKPLDEALFIEFCKK